MGSSDTIPSATGRWGAQVTHRGTAIEEEGPGAGGRRTATHTTRVSPLHSAHLGSSSSCCGCLVPPNPGTVVAAVPASASCVASFTAHWGWHAAETRRGPVAVAFIGKIFWPRFAPRSVDRPGAPLECRTGGQRQGALTPVTADSVVLLLGDVSCKGKSLWGIGSNT